MVEGEKMYSREFKDPPEQVVTKGKAAFGTYNGVPKKIDIRDLHAPFAQLPMPSFITNLFIKSNLFYFFDQEKYIGITGFADFKVFGLATVTIWNKETGKKYSYHTIMPLRKRFVPKKTSEASCTSFSKARHIRISWGRKHEHHSLSFRLKGNSAKPAVNGFIYSSFNDQMHGDFLFVNPSPVKSRCKATWFTTMQTHGLIKVGSEHSDDSNGLGAMLLTRAYYNFRNKTTITCAMGEVNSKKIIFELTASSLDAADADRYNDNVLIVDGEESALPPVYMTHSFGKDKAWTIQDTESMIDLTFNPISLSSRQISVFPSRNSYTMIYGTFEGVLLDKNGTKYNLKKLPGILYDNFMRL